MSVLILGAQGMLGTMLCSALSDLRPTCWDVDDIDITNETQVAKRISELGPDVIINAAAYTNVDGAEKDRATAFQVNEDGPRNIAKAAQSIGAKFVHYSTDYVFPGTHKHGYLEADTPGPAINIYGESKLAGEKAVLEHCTKGYIIRTAWLYGPHGKNFVETMLALARTKPVISVVNDQFGSPTFTKDVTQFTRTLLEEDFEPGVYHAVNSGRASWYEFAKAVFVAAGVEVEVKPVASAEFVTEARRPEYSMLKNSKGPIMRPWQDALREYILARQE